MTLRFFVGIMKKDNREVDYGSEEKKTTTGKETDTP
jgi:hypothetical protein